MSVAFSSYVVDAHAKEVSEIYSELSTSSEGLSESEASKRLLQNGPNELRKHEAETMTQKFMEQFKEPLILLLLCSALISMIMCEVADAIGIFIAVCIVNFVGIYQEYKSEKSVEALKSLTAHSCTVVRAREIKEVDAKSIVVGDIVVLNIGDRSPADLRLTETVSFQMAESLLTGEPEPVSKYSKAIIPGSSGSSSSKSSDDDDDKDEDNDPRAHSQNHQRMANMSKAKKNIAYMGTTCANGRATGVVVAVGDQTELGKISLQMQSIKAGKSPLQRKMKEIGKQLSMLAFGIVAVIFIVGAIQQKNLLEMFTIGVSLAVAAIPEGLPIVVTVTLALGVTRMASRKAIVRKLPAVEALGATTVICTDKTGTLTQNVMTVTRVFTTEVFDVSNPPSLSASASHHHHHQQSLHDVSVHVSDSNAFYFGHESDCSPIFYRRRQFEEKSSLNPLKDPLLYELLKASLICNNAQFNGTELVGQPTEGALLSLALKTGMKDLRITNQRLSEQPFSSETKMMSVEYDLTSGDDEGRCFFVKGAVERVLDSCAYFLDEGQQTVVLDNSKRSEILQTFREFGNDALRVLAIAKGQSKDRMTFLGLVGLIDPPKIGVKDAIKKSQESGVHVVMVTGDGRDTAVAVARELGIKSYRYFVNNIKSSAQRSLLGTGSSSSASKFSVPRSSSSSSSSSSDGMKRKDSSDALFFRTNEEEDHENEKDGIVALSSYDMENMNKDQLADIVDDVAVFYRVTPQNKVDIVEAFKRKGHIVAMTGDGVNDAPALKIADIGIAMGIAGTDVSKEAAEMILVDDNFSTIIAAIEEGKGIYNNIKNFLRFQLTTSIATLSIVAASTLFGLPLPLNPIQILWINIIMDGPPAQSLGVEPLDDDVMKRPPRDVNAPIFTPEMIFCILTSASIMVLGTLGTFYYELLFHPDEFGAAEKRAITVSFTTFVFFQMFNALNCRSDTKSVTQIGFMRNKFFVVAIGLSALMQLAAIYVPLLQMLFETVAITPHDILYSISVASSVLIFEEVRKLYIRRSLNFRSRSSSSRPYSV